MAEYTYIDFSNLGIESGRLSTASKGMALDIKSAIATRTFDMNHRSDVRKQDTGRAALFASRTHTDSDVQFWRVVCNAGFENNIAARRTANGGRRVDTGLVVEMITEVQS